MRRLTWLLPLALAGALGCGDDDGDDKTTNEEIDTSKVSEALTSKVDFQGGLLVEGSIPDTSNEKVTLRQSEDKVRLKPGASSLMALDVDNPDESDDPVMSTLLQFEESDDHIEVARSNGSDAGDAGASDPSRVEINFEVGDDVCEGLCNTIFEIEMQQAVKMSGGGISKKLNRIFELDCTDDGDPDECPKAAKPDAGTAGKTGGGAGTGSGMMGSTTAARELRGRLNTVNMTACTCADMTGTACEAAPYPAAAVTCIDQAVQMDGALTAGATCLAANLNSAATACACEMTCFESVIGSALAKCAATDAITTALEDCELPVAAP